MNDFFFRSAWSFVLSSVIKTQNVHQDKVNQEAASCLDSCDLALTQRQKGLFLQFWQWVSKNSFMVCRTT